jgi:hypothetical protein
MRWFKKYLLGTCLLFLVLGLFALAIFLLHDVNLQIPREDLGLGIGILIGLLIGLGIGESDWFQRLGK